MTKVIRKGIQGLVWWSNQRRTVSVKSKLQSQFKKTVFDEKRWMFFDH